MKNVESLYGEADKGEAFRLLSEFYQLPEQGMGSKLKALERQMAKACHFAVPFVSRMREHLEGEGDVESLKVEYTKLFLGPFRVPAPPYGSVYLNRDRTFMGKSTMDVLHRYQQEGLDISSRFHDAPDHITAELEFVYFLNLKAIETAEDAAGDAPTPYLEKRKHFLMDHLGAWISDFERLIEETAETDFYKNLIRATKALINGHASACRMSFHL